MREEPAYTEFHPRWLRHPTSTYWWLQRWSYFVFVLRELTSVFVAWSTVYLLLLVRAMTRGGAAYQAFLDWSSGPVVLLLNVVALGFVLFHAITWFNLASQAMVVKMGRTTVPGFLIAASNYAAWAVVSALVVWLVLGRS